MEKTWENIRDEIVKKYKITSITHDGRLIAMADTENLFEKSWVYFKEYQAESWVEIYSAMHDSIGIDEILHSQENIHPEASLELIDNTIMGGFINVSNVDIHKIVTRLVDYEPKSLIFALTCFQEAADQIEDEDLEAKSQINNRDIMYILRIYSKWDIPKDQYASLTAQLEGSDISEHCHIVCIPYEADLPDEEYEHWLDNRIKEKETSEEEYVKFCRSHGLSEEIYPPDLKAAKLLYYTMEPRIMADLVLTDDEQIARTFFPKIVEFASKNGLAIYDWQSKEDVDLDDPGQFPPGWTRFYESLEKNK